MDVLVYRYKVLRSILQRLSKLTSFRIYVLVSISSDANTIYLVRSVGECVSVNPLSATGPLLGHTYNYVECHGATFGPLVYGLILKLLHNKLKQYG